MFKKILLTSTFVSLISITAIADIVTGSTNTIGPSGNMGFDNPGSRMDVNINSNPGGSVGQMDWRQFTPAQQSKVNIQFEALHQTTINRVFEGKSQDLTDRLKAQNGTYSSEIVQDSSFSPVEQAQIQRIDRGKAQDIINKTNQPNVSVQYLNDGNLIIQSQNAPKL